MTACKWRKYAILHFFIHDFKNLYFVILEGMLPKSLKMMINRGFAGAEATARGARNATKKSRNPHLVRARNTRQVLPKSLQTHLFRYIVLPRKPATPLPLRARSTFSVLPFFDFPLPERV